MTERTKRISRRNFLLTAGAGGAATAAAILAKNVPQAEAAAAAPGKRSTRGYQASEHVKNFYRTAKI
jgi:hypothetical protein